MSTMAAIAKKSESGIESICCYFDGDLCGEILEKHYSTEEALDKLLRLGDIEALKKTVNNITAVPASPAMKFETEDEWYDEYCGCEFFYMFNPKTKKWSCESVYD